ncbi:universal stress protein [Streptomyces sp. NPDC101152]|uniref:universal stress protein n=1 Tax=Streptomyces sp. NPDC101152 TaxID=3366116 RepID=UPI00381EC3D1
MERVIIAFVDESAQGRAAADWAEREAALRALPLRLEQGPPSSDRTYPDAELIVLGLDRRLRLPAPLTAPVVVVPSTPYRLPETVTVGLDARNPASGVLGFAFEEARLRGVLLRVVHAWRLPAQAAERSPLPVLEEDRATWEDQEVQALSDVLRPWRGKYPDVGVLEDVVLLQPAEALVHAAGTSGLVVVGRRTGDTALGVLEVVRCPVALVPAP